MTKYSSEFKLKVVKYCVEYHHSMCSAARKFGIPSSTPLKEWIKKYKEHGTEGLIKQQKHGSAQEEELNKRRKGKRRFEMRKRKFSKSKTVKGKNKNFKDR